MLSPTILEMGMQATFSYARLQRQDSAVGGDVDKLKQHLPLLDYLRQHNWIARPAGRSSEFVGLCRLHAETRPSFYVNARKNLFYCHGCGQGGDLIRFVQLSRNMSFRQSLAYLEQPAASPDDSAAAVLQKTPAFLSTAARSLSRGDALSQSARTGDADITPQLAIEGTFRHSLGGSGHGANLRRVGLNDLRAATGAGQSEIKVMIGYDKNLLLQEETGGKEPEKRARFEECV
jgi:hypothetical protein